MLRAVQTAAGAGLVSLQTLCALAAPEFPAPYDTERDPSRPLPPLEAAERMQLPPGFKATVFASEPDVQNPIALAWDARGRLWVAENYTYAERPLKFDLHLRDRILIFEDTDGDGHFDKRTVFTDDVQMLTSLAIGFGGVWVTCPPRVLFIPDRDGDDRPDAPASTVLDGFAVAPENYHTFANGLRFGPDGWLYGRCGASSAGEIGVPGTPPEERLPLRGTLWRYHPQRKSVEVLSSGTTNPWGHDWDEHGELFFINTVNGHLWHHFAGAHYMRPHTIDPNPRVYGLIDQHADHWHFDTTHDWSQSRDGAANAFGGGHAHAGMMIYLGDNWPDEYRGRLFTLNLHGRRANQELLERKGSGYIGRHGPDFMIAADPWFRGMEMSYGPDGGVYVLDWSDAGECHESTGVHRRSGRIYKIVHGASSSPEFPDLRQASVEALAGLLSHRNEWFARQARLELNARALDGRGTGGAPARLLRTFAQSEGTTSLQALWTLYGMGATSRAFLAAQLSHRDEHIRAWAIRLLTDSWPLDTVMSQRPRGRPEASREDLSVVPELCQLGRNDPSGLIRLVLASTLQRLPVELRAELACALVSRKEDAQDHNLPLLIWYGLIPLGGAEPGALVRIAEECQLPLTRRCISRRLTEDVEKNSGPLNELLSWLEERADEPLRMDVLSGMAEALKGWRQARKPAAWDALVASLANTTNSVIREQARELSVVFGDGRALDDLKTIVRDEHADLVLRKTALQTLIENRPPDLRRICEPLLRVQFLNPVAARGLSTFNDADVGGLLVNAYRSFHPSERPQLIAALVSRRAFAKELLEAIGEGRIPRQELSAFHARQIESYQDEALNELLTRVWGKQRERTADKQEWIAQLKRELSSAARAKGDPVQGRAVFQLVCASCHRLYGEGGNVGPDLTGAGRDNLDYLLENIVDPSAVVAADFRMSVVNLKDGRSLNCFITAQTERTLTVQTMTEKLALDRQEVESVEESSLSLMPEGLLETLDAKQRRDLIAYLMHR